MMMDLQHHRAYQEDRLGTPGSPVAADGIEMGVLAGTGLSIPLVKARSAQCGHINLHSRDLLLGQENKQYIVGSAECFIRDKNMNHVVVAWSYTKAGNAWSPLGAHLVALPLGKVIAPLAYITMQDKLVLALPRAWL